MEVEALPTAFESNFPEPWTQSVHLDSWGVTLSNRLALTRTRFVSQYFTTKGNVLSMRRTQSETIVLHCVFVPLVLKICLPPKLGFGHIMISTFHLGHLVVPHPAPSRL